ncbi:MAG: thioredoxin [Pedosphaera sp.]|nr:thioredoxin [Pedosphaera sp.]
MKTPIEVDEQNFKTEVLNSKQPVLVIFLAERDELSKKFAPMIEEVASEFSGRMNIARINVERNPELTRLCFIKTLPTMLYFADGMVRDRTVGIETKGAIVSRLEVLLLKL